MPKTKSEPRDRMKFVVEDKGGHFFVHKPSYSRRHAFKSAGGVWDKEAKGWNIPKTDDIDTAERLRQYIHNLGYDPGSSAYKLQQWSEEKKAKEKADREWPERFKRIMEKINKDLDAMEPSDVLIKTNYPCGIPKRDGVELYNGPKDEVAKIPKECGTRYYHRDVDDKTIQLWGYNYD